MATLVAIYVCQLFHRIIPVYILLPQYSRILSSFNHLQSPDSSGPCKAENRTIRCLQKIILDEIRQYRFFHKAYSINYMLLFFSLITITPSYASFVYFIISLFVFTISMESISIGSIFFISSNDIL